MFSRYLTPLNIVFSLSLLGLLLVIFGFIPREWIFIPTALILGYLLFVPHQRGVLFFVRFIPFFFALPLTANFDNFNLWRIAIVIIFVKWLVSDDRLKQFFASLWRISWWRKFARNFRVEFLGIVLLAIALVSIWGAEDISAAVKRFMYIVNMILLLVVIRDLVRSRQGFFQQIAQNFLISGIAVTFFGFLQLASTYFAPPWIWHYWWGQVVSLGMYGRNWADIVTNFGNTWFSYSGGGLRLRMFSLFPDSHSFPMYLLMILPAFFLVSPLGKLGIWRNLKNMGSSRRGIVWIGVFLAIHLALVLSGTRGIWVSIIFPALFIGIVWWRAPSCRMALKTVSLSLLAFVIVFPLAWGIYFLPQFQEDSVSSSDAFVSRIGSLFDFNETSNQGRIAIWSKTAQSIVAYPVLGVGIGNFPTILKQNISASKAGSSAHNLYLHIAAEMGIFALIAFLWMCGEFVKRGWMIIRNVDSGSRKTVFVMATLFSFVWILGYSMTDAALFDGRAFLGFMVLMGMMLGLSNSPRERSL